MPFVLAQFGLGDQPWVDPVVAIGGVIAAALTAAVVHLLLYPLAMRIGKSTPTELDDILIRASRWPVSVGIVLLGIYLSVTLVFDLTATQLDIVDIVFKVAGTLTGISLVVRLVSRCLDWLAYRQMRGTARRQIDSRLLPTLRRTLIALVYVLGALLLLSVLGIPISPLIAGLGLGGVAVALAIQPTLSNLFAGTYVMTEGVVSPGDYIEMEGGIAGYVLEVGWRSTRLRTWSNNLVVVPNARFAETIITNYYEPEPPVNVFLTCGASYDSNLARVEVVSMEVMNTVLDTSPHGVKEYGAYFGFDNFGDSNVDFWLFVQARDRLASFELRSALIHELHRRFDEEGIVINYPVRSIQFPNGAPPDEIARSATMRAPAMVRRTAHPDTPEAGIAGGDGPDGPS